MRFIIIIAGVLLITSCQQQMAEKAQLFMDYEGAERQKVTDSKTADEYVKKFETKYHELFDGKKFEFAKYNDKTLKGIWLASYLMASYHQEQKYLLQMEGIFETLKLRGDDKKVCFESPCAEELYAIYLRFTDFPKAKLLTQQYPDILKDLVPDIHEDPAALNKPHKLYKISPDGKSLNLISAPFGDSRQIIMLLNPECDFARQAMKSILSTPDIRKYFEKYALIICPVYSSISSIAEAAKWNTMNPKLEYYVYLNRKGLKEDWKQFEMRAMTDFYFIKNGQIIHRIPGWGPTDAEFVADLRKAINKLEGLK